MIHAIKKNHRLILWSLLFIGFLLRVLNINFGLPQIVMGDEIVSAYRAFVIVSQGPAAGSFGGFAVLADYINIIIFGVLFLYLKLTGTVSSPASLFMHFLKDPSLFIVSGRIIFVFISCGLIYATYRLGKRLFSDMTALIAAFFMSIGFLPVITGRYVKDDTSVALLVVLFFLFTLTRKYVIAHFLLGIAVATRYIPIGALGFFFSRIPNASQLANVRSVNKKRMWMIFCALVFGIVIANPVIILYFQKFTSAFSATIDYRHQSYVASFGFSRIFQIASDVLFHGWGIMPLILSTLGLSSLFKNGRFKNFAAKEEDINGFLYGYAAIIALFFLTGSEFPRFAMVFIPFLAILAGVGFEYATEMLTSRRWRVIFVLALIVGSVQILAMGIKFITISHQPDTRQIAQKWIEENLPEGAFIINEGYQTRFGKPMFGVTLYPTDIQIERYKKYASKTYAIDAFALEATQHRRFTIIPVIQLSERWDYYGIPVVEDSAAWMESADYVVTTSWSRPNKQISQEFMEVFNRQFEKMYEVKANPEMLFDPHNWRFDWKAIKSVSLLRKDQIFGPEIKIYRKRHNVRY